MDADRNDDQMVADLLAATPAARAMLYQALDRAQKLSNTRQLAKWSEPVGSGTQDDPYQLRYPIYDPSVIKLLDALVVVSAQPIFDWMAWDGRRRYADVESIARAPLADVLRVITTIIRGERFCDGTIDGALTSGVLLAAADRVAQATSPGCAADRQ